MPKLSIIINLDTRPENSHNQEMFKGVVDRDFLIAGILNKRKLFENFDAEYIAFIDEHEPLTQEEINKVKEITDTLIIRKHSKSFENIENFAAFNDFNYLQALFMSRGEYVFHFDQDVAAFAPNDMPIYKMAEWLEKYKFVSYPSHWSPNPVDDASFENKYWVSTRFFACKRSSLDFTELIKCQLDYEYWKEKYPRARLCHWLEHLLQDNTPNCVYYPPINYDYFILFTWENYYKGLLNHLNNSTFEEVKSFVLSKGGIHYPNNITV